MEKNVALPPQFYYFNNLAGKTCR